MIICVWNNYSELSLQQNVTQETMCYITYHERAKMNNLIWLSSPRDSCFSLEFLYYADYMLQKNVQILFVKIVLKF